MTAFLFSAVAAAQPPVTVPRCMEPPVIDGRLDEACWGSAAVLSGFVQTKPGDNTLPSRETSVLLAYDSRALYIVTLKIAPTPNVVLDATVVYPRLTLSFRRQTQASVYLYADYLRLFEEEFGPRRSATQRGAFFGEPDRSTIYKGIVLDLQSKPANDGPDRARASVRASSGASAKAIPGSRSERRKPPFLRISPAMSSSHGFLRTTRNRNCQKPLGSRIRRRVEFAPRPSRL